MSLHKEISFETEICEHLGANGWFYAEGDAAGYDRARTLFPPDLLAWVQATLPIAWEILTKSHGSQAGETLIARARDQIDQRGTLDVLRHGIELLGLKQPLKLAEFKPALAINADILARYAANRLRVIRQVRYSLHNENCIDLVLLLNGLPVATVELSATTDPNLVYNLRAKLDAAGHYDDFEVDRVVAVELSPASRQSDLIAALEPVRDRIIKRYKAAQETLKVAKEKKDDVAVKAAQDELNALILFKSDMGAYIRLYTFLSQIFDYGNTAIEKRAIFYKRLLPLLEFGREREGLDLSKVVLTHHNLRNLGKRAMALGEGESPQLEPITEAGSGSVQEKERAYIRELIEKLNQLFGADTTDQDQLVYVNHVIKGKLLESETLKQQAANNTKEQFANSPDLKTEVLNAIMGALDAHTSMSTQALNSAAVQSGIRDILLNHSALYETLREQAGR